VFPTTIGTPPDAQNIVNRHFKPLLRRAGLPDIRWHDLRHTCATLLLSRGTHPKYVQQLLGHASIQLTLDRYSHWMPSMESTPRARWTTLSKAATTHLIQEREAT
jgi:integrase